MVFEKNGFILITGVVIPANRMMAPYAPVSMEYMSL
jgi:hypothetical protein